MSKGRRYSIAPLQRRHGFGGVTQRYDEAVEFYVSPPLGHGETKARIFRGAGSELLTEVGDLVSKVTASFSYMAL